MQEDYGLSRIEVRDDGSGIKKEDALLVAAPHYTSKLRHFNDLTEVRTYGFRGEALASLAAVANVTVITCTHVDPLSTVYQYDKSGHVTSERPSPLGRGTSVIIANLFQNLPVRKQQYRNGKKCRDEFKRVEDILLAFGLAHPGVRFVLKHNGNLVWQKVQGEGLKSSMNSVFGFSVMQHLLPFEHEDVPSAEVCCGAENTSDVDEGLGSRDSEPVFPFKAVGYLPRANADPSLVTRSSHDRLFLFINNRPVQCKPLLQVCLFVRLSVCLPAMFVCVCTCTGTVCPRWYAGPTKRAQCLQWPVAVPWAAFSCMFPRTRWTSMWSQTRQQCSCTTW